MESTPSKAELAQSNKQLTWRGIFALILLAGALGAGWAVRYRLFPALTTHSQPPNVKVNTQLASGNFAVKLQLPATINAPITTAIKTDPQVTVIPAASDLTPLAAAVAATAIPDFAAHAAPNALAEMPNPLFAPDFDPNDKRPIYVCGTDSFASYITLLQIQVARLDVQHGFHLGIVPLQFNDREYAFSQQDVDTALKTGKWDCNPNTVDGVASTNNGVITAIVDESAGGDGIWARKLSTIYDLKGKRIAYVAGSSSEFFARYALSVAQLDPAADAILLPFETPDDAVKAFNDGRADAVSAWDPQLAEAGKGGGTPLVTSDQLRIIVDAIITSRKSIEEKPNVVQAFHDAWFEALKLQFEQFDVAARQIAAWGHPDWSGISAESADADFRAGLKKIAQADLEDNLYVMNNPESIINLMNASRRVWSLARKVPTDPVQNAIDGRFVNSVFGAGNGRTTAQPVNNSFSLSAANISKPQGIANSNPAATSTTNVTATTQSAAIPAVVSQTLVASDGTESLAVLPCRRFTFLPNSAVLTEESRKVIDLCVVPLLQQRPNTALRILGSSAWPGPKGSYTENKIMEMAVGRAKAIADYLATQKIANGRLVVEGTLPPDDRREIDDPVRQMEDRFVEMTLITSGR